MTSSMSSSDTTRRRVIGAALGAGALGVLTACGGSDAEAGGPDAPDTAPGTTAESSAAAAALVATSEVPVNGGVVLEAEKIVVTQPTEGTFKAYTAVCTHNSCTVASVEDGIISCPCHGSQFRAADGSVANGPATRPLKEIPVTVEGSDVVRA